MKWTTALLVFIVVLTEPEGSGKRKIGKLAGKELKIMKSFKPEKEPRYEFN